jgi:hypothetical protein
MDRWLLAVAVVCGLLFSLTDVAHAQARKGHSEYLAGLTQRSLRQGFPRRNVPLLDVEPGPGREARATALLEHLRRAGLGSRLRLMELRPDPKAGRILTYMGDAGYFEVMADGSKLRARSVIDDRDQIARAGTRRMGKAELERAGRRFVRGSLAPFVRLGRGERLRFWGVRYLKETGGNVPAGSREQPRTVASIAIFGREVGGLPVVGSGSKIAVWFDNARRPVAFDVDWPVYRISRTTQRTLPMRELSRRVGATVAPLRGDRARRVRRFECGYVDLGASRRGNVIQTGCSIAFEGRGEGGEAWARVEHVPAGAEVLRDERWPLANALASGQVVNSASPEFQRYLTGPKDPPPAAPPTQQ